MMIRVLQSKKVAPVVALLLAAQSVRQTLAAPPSAPIPHDSFLPLQYMKPLTAVDVSTIFNPTVYNQADVVTTSASFGSNAMIAMGVTVSFGAALFVLGLRTLYKAKPR